MVRALTAGTTWFTSTATATATATASSPGSRGRSQEAEREVRESGEGGEAVDVTLTTLRHETRPR
nr:hypothetical protein GCM10020241_49310 [Streptoalloteichus tenebrarius]